MILVLYLFFFFCYFSYKKIKGLQSTLFLFKDLLAFIYLFLHVTSYHDFCFRFLSYFFIFLEMLKTLSMGSVYTLLLK